MYFYPRRFRRRYSYSRKQRNRYARTLLKKPQNINAPIDPSQVERYKDFILRNNIIKIPQPSTVESILMIRPNSAEKWVTPPENQYLHTIRHPHHEIFKTSVTNVMYLFVIYKENDYYMWLIDRYEGQVESSDNFIHYYTPNTDYFNGWNCRVFKSPVPEEPSSTQGLFHFIADKQAAFYEFRLAASKVFSPQIACEVVGNLPPEGWDPRNVVYANYFDLNETTLVIETETSPP